MKTGTSLISLATHPPTLWETLGGCLYLLGIILAIYNLGEDRDPRDLLVGQGARVVVKIFGLWKQMDLGSSPGLSSLSGHRQVIHLS